MTAHIEELVEKDKAYLWHHLTQHATFKQKDPLIITEGKGMQVWDI